MAHDPRSTSWRDRLLMAWIVGGVGAAVVGGTSGDWLAGAWIGVGVAVFVFIGAWIAGTVSNSDRRDR